MTIAVLNYNSGEVDIIDVDENRISTQKDDEIQTEDVENFLHEEYNYNESEIHYMYPVSKINFL